MKENSTGIQTKGWEQPAMVLTKLDYFSLLLMQSFLSSANYNEEGELDVDALSNNAVISAEALMFRLEMNDEINKGEEETNGQEDI